MAYTELDKRFYYEPLLAGHPDGSEDIGLNFAGKRMDAPIWVSSMTGGAARAYDINRRLARVVRTFKLGMGLGSCRHLLFDDRYLQDFDLRHEVGDQPFYGNLGIAQVEQLIAGGGAHKIENLVKRLQLDGMIIHVNPLQEWIQPEGDRIQSPPIDTIRRLLDRFPDLSLIVKEVGQGFGPASMEALINLPLEAIEFGAAGGTNFAKLESMRRASGLSGQVPPLATIGHSAPEMLDFLETLILDKGKTFRPHAVIVSGGIQNFLDGYYVVQRAPVSALYGQASAFLSRAASDYSSLRDFVSSQVEGLRLATKILRIRERKRDR